MSRSAILGLIVILELGFIEPHSGMAQNVRPDAPDISIIYWYNKANPQGTIQFKVYDGAYPMGPVRDWMAQNKINDVNSDLRGCPCSAPFRIQLSRYPAYRNGTTTKEEIVRAVEEQIRKNLPAPEIPFQRLPTVDVRPIRTERLQPPSRQPQPPSRFSYNPNAPNLVGSKWERVVDKPTKRKVTLDFKDNGVLNYNNEIDNWQASWQANGSNLTIRYSHSTYTGVIDGDTMTGVDRDDPDAGGAVVNDTFKRVR